MNVLLATDSNVERAGVCMFMLDWVRGIRQIDKDGNVVVYFRKGILDKNIALQYKKLGAKVIYSNLPQNASNVSIKYRNKIKRNIRSIIKRYDFDIMHVNSSAAGFASLVLSEGKKAGIPIRIAHSHGRNIGNGIKNIYLWFLKYQIKKNATKYAGCSQDAGKYLYGESVLNSDNWCFVPNTIETDKFIYDASIRKEYRSALGIEDNEILLGATGMLTDIKNHIFLLPVVKMLNQKDKNVKLLILGEGEKRKELEEMCERLNIKSSVYLPGVSDKISQWLSAMDIYVMPSLIEGLPIGAVEAQANGLYCVLSSSIPNDVDLSDDVIHVTIDKGATPWVNTISKIILKSDEQRKEGNRVVKKAGFDSSNRKDYIYKLYELDN